jgi:hypothetical protein
MSDLITYLVDCKRRGELLATYEFAQAETLAGPPPQPASELLEKQAKENLVQQGLAFPPFDGITFHIRRR